MNITEKTVYEIDGDGIQYPTLRHAQEELMVRMLANHAADNCLFHIDSDLQSNQYTDARSIGEYITKHYNEIIEIINNDY